MTEELVAAIGDYGASGLAAILAISCLGIPVPAALVMLAAGSLVAQGSLAFWPVVAWGLAGSVAGDTAGYLVGRFGGERLKRVAAGGPASKAIARAEAFAHRWGDAGIFFSRWLVSPLGPWINLASGMAGFPWPRFVLWDLLGEGVWVFGYVGLGLAFSRSVQTVADTLGNLTWFVVFGLIAVILGWWLRRHPGS